MTGRAQAWAIVTEFTQSESLRRHMLSVGHPVVGSRILRERGVPEPIIKTILTHAED